MIRFALLRRPVVLSETRDLLFAGLLVLAACGGGLAGPGALTRANPAPVATVSVVPGPQSITAGTTYLSAVLRDSAGYVLVGRTVTWMSADTNIAVVATPGYVTARKPGQTTITATSEGVSGSAIVTVPPPPSVATVLVTPDSVALELGQGWQINYSLRDSVGHFTTSSNPTTWSSSDPTRVTVSSSGVLTGTGVGTALVTATNGSKGGSIPVRVFPTMPAGSLLLSPDSVTVTNGASQYFTVTVKDTAGNRVFRPVTWSTSNGSNAQVTSQSQYDAAISTLSTGTVFVIASSGGKQGTAKVVIVPQPTVAQLTVAPTAATLVVGRTLVITATARDANNMTIYPPRSWSSSDSSKATVSDGRVTAIAAGTATITVTAGGKTAQTTLTLTTPAALPLVAVASGPWSACGLTTAGAGYCWGFSRWGMRGDGTASDTLAHPVPARVTGSQVFSAITLGYSHACGIAAGSAYCWGANMQGQLGIGAPAPTCLYYDSATQCSAVPVAVAGSLVVRQVSAAAMSTCAVTTGDAAYCWGDNSSGQLGTGTSTASTTPVAVTGAHSFTSVSAGRFHVCGLATDGKAFCWGNDGAGQLGAPTRTTCTDAFARTVVGCSLVPLAVSGGLTFTSLVSGDDHTCALTSAGTAYCWGSNVFGELGNGTQTTTDIPRQVAGGLHFMSLSAAGANTCGLTSAGAAYCWGSNAYGQLGTGSTSDFLSSPVLVSGGMTFESISTGSNHSCGVTASHVAYCWGSNLLGQQGTGNVGGFVPRVAVTTP